MKHKKIKIQSLPIGKSCPISRYQIPEKQVRISAWISFIILGIALIFSHWLGFLLLGLDFLMRGFQPKWSLVATVARTIYLGTPSISHHSKMVNAGPKYFAARIGTIFSLVLLFAYLFQLTTFGYIVGFVFGVCVLAEASLGFCVACKIYPYWRALNAGTSKLYPGNT